MIKIQPDEVKRWRLEIEKAEEFKKEHFGSFKDKQADGVAENINYFEYGAKTWISDLSKNDSGEGITLNIIHPIVKNVIPSLFYKNPRVLAFPKRKQDEDSAPIAAEILNYFYRELDIKSQNILAIFDAYVLGFGVIKAGYSTQFGVDVKDDNLEKDREKKKQRGILERLGLKKPVPEEDKKNNVDRDEHIRVESPYLQWVNPFNFFIDPRANSIYDAQYVFEKITKNLYEVKKNSNYKNTDDLRGSEVDEKYTRDIPEPQLDRFKTIDIYHITYKDEDGYYLLVLAKDGQEYRALRHEKSIYKIDGFQYEMLDFNKHGHKLYPKSDITKIRPLQDRINSTFDAILEQVDKFVSKVVANESAFTEDGKKALRDGDIGAICWTKTNVNDAAKMLELTQVKSDLMAMVDKILEIIMIETGLTRAMLTGMTEAQTATEAQIGQAGQNLRLTDKSEMVQEFVNRQARKLWQIITQFVDLEEIELITGEAGIDEITGQPKFSWMQDKLNMGEMSEKLAIGEYRFEIEVGSTQRPNTAILIKQIENAVNILADTDTIMLLQQQGYKIELAEIVRKWLQQFPEVFPNLSRIIKPVSPQTPGMLPQLPPPGQGQAGASRTSQAQAAPPNMANIISSLGGEKGQGAPLA